MMLDSALYLASLGFHVFPLRAGLKRPRFPGWCEDATCDLEAVEAIWTKYPKLNVGISTSWYTNGEVWHVLGVDVDNKLRPDGTRAQGTASAIALGELLPETFVQRTPTGGYHYLYKTRVPVGNPVGDLGDGLDIRGWHGLLVGAGSVVPAGQYTIALSLPVAEAPRGLVDLVGRGDTRVRAGGGDIPAGVDSAAAHAWGVRYLKSLVSAPNGTIAKSSYAAACVLRQRGVAPADIFDLLLEHFKSDIPLDEEKAGMAAYNSAKYMRDAPGSLAPEIIFQKDVKPTNPPPAGEPEEPDPAAGTPIAWMNERHAFVLIGSGGNVVMKDTDAEGKPTIRMLGVEGFHNFHAGLTIQNGDSKPIPLSRAWMSSKYRKTFSGIEFGPGIQLPKNYYNLWQGFSFEPQKTGSDRAHRALGNFLHHHVNNVHRGDKALAHHSMAWFAHMVQKPWEKVSVSLVVRGGKGSGKDTWLDIFGGLLGPHYWITADKNDLVGQFSAQLESLLLFGLNEAFWAHDKEVEGKLKHIVSGRKIRIERKFCDPYRVRNYMRIVIMGNESVQVPATDDERRWFVIDTRDIPDAEQLEHIAFCTELREGMEAGGYPLLLDYLLNYDIAGVVMNRAPNTQGLVEQKMAGLHPVQMWFRECLSAGSIIGCGVPMGWPDRIDKELIRQAFRRWRKEHDIAGREPGEDAIGGQLMKMRLGIDGSQKRVEGKATHNQYSLPPLEDCRKNWDVFIKAVKETKW